MLRRTLRLISLSNSELKICHTLAEFESLRLPALVLACSSFVNTSFAEDIVRKWAEEKKNLFIFTNKPRVECLATELLRQPKPKRIIFKVLVPVAFCHRCVLT
jgi:Cft2 family RNA processing exonuclease